MNPKKLARTLGWFSIGLGLLEVAAPGALSRFLGVSGRRKLLRAFGVRELAAGVGILSQRRQRRMARRLAPWLWARVAGDALDLLALGTALARSQRRRNLAIAAGAVAGVTALDVIVGQRLSA